MDDGLWASFSKWFSEKTSSPLYFTYIGFFVIWNWQFFQIIFLEDKSLFSSPRVEYINSKLLFSIPFNEQIPYLVATTVNWLANISWHIIPPAVFTFLAIKFLPKLHKWAFDIYIKNYFHRKDTYRRENLEYLKQETKNLKEEAAYKTEQKTQRRRIVKAQTQEEKWNAEFEQVKRQDLLQAFQRLVAVLYKHGGVLYGTQVESYLPNSSAIMAFAGTHDLINTEKRESGSPIVQLTDKGKYFSRLLADKGVVAQ